MGAGPVTRPGAALHFATVSRRAWFVLAVVVMGPGLLLLGAVLGQWLLRPVGPAVWTDARQRAEPAPKRTLPSLAPIVQRVRGGVVGIRTIRRIAREGEAPDGPVTDRDLDVVNGTGFVINASGLAVTNHHLVAEHERILVEVPGFRAVRAELVGADPITDIAVVRFAPPPEGLTALKLGDSTRIEQGDFVLAIGNPFMFRQTVTFGTVSYVGRHIPEEGLLVSNEYLQFSASVNPGSSGGPVLDMEGNVVGVTTSTHAEGSGISFAVPSKVLKWVLAKMDRADGRVRRGFLGIRLQPVDRATAAALDLEGGAIIRHVEADRPAHQAGLRARDIVVSYNGKPVPDAYALFDWITYSEPGGEAVMDVLRNGRRIPSLIARLGEVEYPKRVDMPSEILKPTSSN